MSEFFILCKSCLETNAEKLGKQTNNLEKWRSGFIEADCLIDTLAGEIRNALDTLNNDQYKSRAKRAAADLQNALDLIDEYTDAGLARIGVQ